ncbi:MAG: uracil-xanthine permease [Ruminococcaceae bacterium]|nr:uracil-xanthine permease [Oscillospiraceae bacterium]
MKGVLPMKKLTGKDFILGFQHMFAMFGATVLVPLLTGLDIATTLLMAGLGTLLFHFITGGKVPAFLGSSFAFLGGYAAIAPMIDGAANHEMIPYASLGVVFAGLLYLVLALLFKLFGAKRVMKFFPPVVTGPIIIAIGLILAPSAIDNCKTNWWIAIVAFLTIVICNIWGKGMIKIVPILIGIGVSCALAVVLQLCGIEVFDPTKIQALKDAAWLGFPIRWDHTVFVVSDMSKAISAIIAIVPIALAAMMEHIGDISAISSTVGKNFIANPGMHRTLTGDGLATSLSALFGGPANTTYGENTGVLALTKVYDPRVIRLAAVFAVILSFSPKVAALINLIPAAVIGGISLILYGMISAIGARNLVENKVDLSISRNIIIAATILVSALGFNSIGGISFQVFGTTVTLTGLALAALLGIVMNAILPGKDYDFKEEDEGDKSVDFKL